MSLTLDIPRDASVPGIKPFIPGFSGLRCGACDAEAPTGPNFVCSRCFGPLRAAYDYGAVAQHLTRESIAQRPRTLWRYAELLPVERIPTDGLPVGCSPLVPAPRLAARLGRRQVWIKDDSRNPTLSFKDRVVAISAARARDFGFHTLACASTGNLAASVAATAASLGLRAVVLVPADLEPAKVAQAVALGGTVVRIDGPYDAANRLSLELTDELDGWAVLNVNLRPFYAEGSKSIAFEIAEQLGWRAPDVVVAPLASGSMYTKIAQGFDELAQVGLIERRTTRYVGGQAAGCGPIAAAFAAGSDEIVPVAEPATIVRSLAIGSPADGRPALELARTTRGSIEGVTDVDVVAAVRLLAKTEGILTETAGGVTLAALQQAIRRGVVGGDDEVVVVISGNGLKTIDVLAEVPSQVIAPTFEAFEAHWAEVEGIGMSTAQAIRSTLPNALVSTDWAREHLVDPQVRFLEVDVDTDAYETGHLPGATGINWKSQLTDPVVRDLVSRDELQSLLRDAGIDDDTTIVLYGDNHNWFAAWAYWQLRYQGLDNVRLLDGGRAKVEADGLPLTTDAPSHDAGSITLPNETHEELRAYRQQVIDGVGSAERDLVDVRSPEEFRGELAAPAHLPQEAAQRRGHIPGAVNVPWSTAVAEDGTFKPIEQLRELYAARGIDGEDEVVAYCRIGERSSHTWFVLHELLGYRNVRNYDGSWTEYGSLVGVPIETGEGSAR